MKSTEDIRKELENLPTNTAWNKGVRNFAIDLFDALINNLDAEMKNGNLIYIVKLTETDLLDGANDWNQYSHYGCTCASIYDRDIQKALAPNDLSEGSFNCNGKTWLDLQAEALEEAARILLRIANNKIDNYTDSKIEDCTSQLSDLIFDRESFCRGDEEFDEVFRTDIYYLNMAIDILNDYKRSRNTKNGGNYDEI